MLWLSSWSLEEKRCKIPRTERTDSYLSPAKSRFLRGSVFLLTVGSFLLTVGLCCLRSIRFGFFCSQLKFGLVFLLLMVENRFGLFCYGSARLEIGLGLFGLRCPPSGNWVWSFLLTVPPLQVKKDEP